MTKEELALVIIDRHFYDIVFYICFIYFLSFPVLSCFLSHAFLEICSQVLSGTRPRISSVLPSFTA